MRHLTQLCVPPPSDEATKAILSTILGAFLSDWSPDLRALCGPIVASAVEAYNTIRAQLLPTPDKSHYNFNLRDLSKVAQVSRLPETWQFVPFSADLPLNSDFQPLNRDAWSAGTPKSVAPPLAHYRMTCPLCLAYLAIAKPEYQYRRALDKRGPQAGQANKCPMTTPKHWLAGYGDGQPQAVQQQAVPGAPVAA